MTRAAKKWFALLMLGGLAPIGCGSAGKAVGGPDTTLYGAAEGDDEVAGFLPKTGQRDGQANDTKDMDAPRRAAGLRGGILLPGDSSEENWDRTSVFSLFVRPSHPPSKRVKYELSVDYASVKRSDGFVTSHVYAVKGGFLWNITSARPDRLALYLTAAAGAAFGDSSWEATGDGEASSTTQVEYGIGIGPGSSRWDLRATYLMYTDSGNVEGGMLVALSSAF